MSDYHQLAQRTSAPITPEVVARMKDREVLADLLSLLAQIKNLGEALTRLKKYVFYGKGPFEGFHAITTRTDAAVHKIRYDWEVKFLHGAIGIISESGELAEMLFNWLYNNGEIHIDNVVEELGDNSWFAEEMLAALKLGGYDIDMADVHRANILKLAARYGDKFSEDRAILRSLDAERVAREGAFTRKSMQSLPGQVTEQQSKAHAKAIVDDISMEQRVANEAGKVDLGPQT